MSALQDQHHRNARSAPARTSCGFLQYKSMIETTRVFEHAPAARFLSQNDRLHAMHLVLNFQLDCLDTEVTNTIKFHEQQLALRINGGHHLVDLARSNATVPPTPHQLRFIHWVQAWLTSASDRINSGSTTCTTYKELLNGEVMNWKQLIHQEYLGSHPKDIRHQMVHNMETYKNKMVPLLQSTRHERGALLYHELLLASLATVSDEEQEKFFKEQELLSSRAARAKQAMQNAAANKELLQSDMLNVPKLEDRGGLSNHMERLEHKIAQAESDKNRLQAESRRLEREIVVHKESLARKTATGPHPDKIILVFMNQALPEFHVHVTAPCTKTEMVGTWYEKLQYDPVLKQHKVPSIPIHLEQSIQVGHKKVVVSLLNSKVSIHWSTSELSGLSVAELYTTATRNGIFNRLLFLEICVVKSFI